MHDSVGQVDTYYCGDLEGKQYMLAMQYVHAAACAECACDSFMGCLKKVINQIVDELEKDPLDIKLARLNDRSARPATAD